jgi:hypothetical protein
VAVQQYVTTNDALLAPFSGRDVHGGPPVVLMEGDAANGGRPYFLGVLHFFKVCV